MYVEARDEDMQWHRGIFAQGHCLYRFSSATARCKYSLSTGGGGSSGLSELVDNRGVGDGGGQGLPECISAWECMHFVSPKSADVGAEGLRLTTTRRMPLLSQPDHVLVRVEAASLNPVDVLMLKGYGAQPFRRLRQLISLASLAEASPPEFPLTPGRDFAGEIVDLGPTARSLSSLKVGQKVAGATWPHLSSSGSGALAEYLVCPAGHLAAIPPSLLVAHNGVQSAAAVGYSGLTAWSALTCAGGMQARVRAPTGQGPLVLVNAATGGVGLIAAQLARLWGARVHVTCRADKRAIELMDSFGFDEVIVYPDMPSFSTAYDIIIDCRRPDYLDSSSMGGPPGLALPSLFDQLRPGVNSRYVCLNPPLLHYMDTWGPVLGAGVATGFALGGMLSAWLAAATGVSSKSSSPGNSWPPGQLRWAFFKADGARLDQLLRWLASGQLRVPIDTVLLFAQAPQAFARLQVKGVRGKVVVVVRGTPH